MFAVLKFAKNLDFSLNFPKSRLLSKISEIITIFVIIFVISNLIKIFDILDFVRNFRKITNFLKVYE